MQYKNGDTVQTMINVRFPQDDKFLTSWIIFRTYKDSLYQEFSSLRSHLAFPTTLNMNITLKY